MLIRGEFIHFDIFEHFASMTLVLLAVLALTIIFVSLLWTF